MLPDTGIPTLAPGTVAVPPGHLATIVTSLEMLHPPPPRPGRPFPPGLALEPLARAGPEAYRVCSSGRSCSLSSGFFSTK